VFDFHWPWAGLMLPLPLLTPWLRARFWPPANPAAEPLEGQRLTLLHPHLERLQTAYQTRRPRRPLAGWAQLALLWLLWLALVLVMMRPQWLTPYTEAVTPGYDLMLAVDASHSMEALDFSAQGVPINRMAVVKGVLGRFIEGRTGDRVGLIVFGSQAFVLSPLSLDRRAARQLLEGMEANMAGPGTALGDAIALGAKKLRERPEGSRVMILVADGDNSAGGFAPEEGAALARAFGARIHVIGVGSEDKSIPIPEEGEIRYREDLTMNEVTLRAIADASGGAYFRATDTRALEEISRRIDELEKTEAETRTVFLPEPLYRWPLGLAMAALLGLGLFPEGRQRIARRTARD